jgi:hypothetical protein
VIGDGRSWPIDDFWHLGIGDVGIVWIRQTPTGKIFTGWECF